MTINIHLNGSALHMTGPLPVLADGTVKKAKFRLFPDADWDGLAIKVVFRRVYAVGVETRTVVIGDVAAEYEIPHEVLHDGWLYIGAVGVAQNGDVRLTTAQMERPLKVSASEDGDADPSGSITPEVADQILALIGSVSNLDTTDKSSLVAAINEVLGKNTAGGVTSVAGKTGDVTLGAADIAANVDGIPADNIAVALAYLLGKIPAGGVTSVNNKTGEVTLDAGDISLRADLSDDLPANSTVQAALEYLRNKLQNGSITPAEGVYVVVENEDDAAVMRKIAAKAEELRQGYEIGVGNVAVPIINTEDSAESVAAAHIVRSEAEKEAAAGDVEVPSVGRVGEMIAAQTPTLDGDTIKDAVKAAAVTDLNITRGGGHYTAKWKDAGTQKNAYIVGGVGLAQVSEILSYVSDTGLPKLHKSKLVGAPMYSVMIGDLLVYTGADYIGSVWSAEVGAKVEQTIAARNEVFRVVTVTTDGDRNECYLVQRTGLILPEIGVTDRREEWLAWLLAEDGQTSDADVAISEVFRFLRTLPDGLHYLDNPGCWGKFWSVNQAGLDGKTKCVVLAPPDIYIITADGGALKMTSTGTLEKYSNNGETLVKSVDLINAVPPKTTAEDALKIWAVGADGTPAWTAVKNVMEVAV